MWFKKGDAEAWERYDAIIAQMNAKVAQLEAKLKEEKKADGHAERIADLEIKMGKLWGMLTDKTPAGGDKLSKYGRMFGGKSRELR